MKLSVWSNLPQGKEKKMREKNYEEKILRFSFTEEMRDFFQVLYKLLHCRNKKKICCRVNSANENYHFN